MGSGRHASYEEVELEFNFKKIQKPFLIFVILAIVVGVIFYRISSKKNKTEENETVPVVSNAEQTEKEKYASLGKIRIDKIRVEQPILDSTEDEALEKGVIKLYGGNLNEEGNFCIAGHNYDDIFGRLKEMEVGDEFEILDSKNQSSIYKIANITTVEPTDLEVLKAKEGKTQMTLITCEDFSTKRLIITAELVD